MSARRIGSRRSAAIAANERTAGAARERVAAPAAAAVPETYDATDGAAALMARHRINPAVIAGSGSNGRIVKADVDEWLQDKEDA